MRLLCKIGKYAFVGFLALFLVVFLGMELYRYTVVAAAIKENRIDSPDGIESLERVTLNGVDQWIYLRGEHKNKPVLLFLHGGPGSPEMPLATKHYQGRLEREFVVVHWDQRGAGKSYSSLDPSQMTLDDYVEDTVELTNLLRNRFQKEKIYLVGHSWGSVLGMTVVSRHPELFHAYIGIGQVASMDEGEKLSYRFTLETAKERGDLDAVADLERIGEPPYDGLTSVGVQRNYLNRYGGVIYGETDPMRILGAAYFRFPHYSTLDLFYRVPVGSYQSLTALWPWLQKKDLFRDVPEVRVPVYFITGRHDHTVTASLTEKYFHRLKAPKKKLIWFERSAHSPNFEEPDRFYEVMTKEVLVGNR